MDHLKAAISRALEFVRTDIWRIRLNDLPRPKSFLIGQLRIILLSIRGFDQNKCQLRASALTFYSLLSIVPVLAMAFGISKGFGFDKLLEAQILENFAGQEEVVRRAIDFAHSLLENTRGGIMAGVGVAVLFWAVIKVLSHIEGSFNEIWEIKNPRTLGRKFSDYLSIMLVSPVLVITSSSATVFITTQVTLITERVAILGLFSPVITLVLNLLPYCLIWILFTFIYLLVPNTKVNFRSGLLAGIVAGTIFQLAQWGYINFQIGIARHNAIYGSFAALPLFLVWLQVSWLIVLFGAEYSFADQNVDTYEFEQDCRKISPRFKKLVTLRVAHLVIKNFSAGRRALTATGISHALGVPIRLVRDLVFELVECGVFSDTTTEEYKELAYQPGRDINVLTIENIIEALEKTGVDNIPVIESDELGALTGSLEAFRETVDKLPANRLLKDI